MENNEIPARKMCAKYRPGHSVHPIQANISHTDSGVWIKGRLRWSNALVGRLTVETDDGEELVFYNHDVDRILSILWARDDLSVVVRGHDILAVPDGQGRHYLFCVRPGEAEPLDACIRPDPVRTMHDGSPDPLPGKPCRTGGAGHSGPYYSKRAWGDGREGERAGRITALDGEVISVAWPDGDVSRFRHHHPERISDIVRKCGTAVLVRGRILAISHILLDFDDRERIAHYLVSIAADTGTPLEPCTLAGKTGIAGFGSLKRLESVRQANE